MEYTFELTDQPILEDEPLSEDVKFLIHGLVTFNDAQAEPENWQRLTLLVRDGNQDVIGGLNGYTHWGWLFVACLWVADELRGQGIGKELIAQAEREAVERGCKHAWLDTFDFQARGFYEKLGYGVFGVLEDFPVGHSRYFLQKRLDKY